MESSICLWIRNELILEFVIFAIVYFIGGFSEIIMINKIVASVVWRIDVDELDHAGVVLAQELQCVEVISFDVQVLGGIPVLAAFFDRSQGFGDGFAGQSFRLALARPCELVTFAVPSATSPSRSRSASKSTARSVSPVAGSVISVATSGNKVSSLSTFSLVRFGVMP